MVNFVASNWETINCDTMHYHGTTMFKPWMTMFNLQCTEVDLLKGS